MNKQLKLKDILTYFNSEDELIEITIDNWNNYIEFAATHPLLKEFAEWTITDMGCIGQDILRVAIKKELES